MMETTAHFNLNDLQKKLFQNKTKNSFYYEASLDNDDDSMEVKEVPLKNGYSLVIGVSTDNRDELLEQIANIILMISIPLLLISVFISFWIAQKFLDPIKKLSNNMKKIKEGERNIKIELPHFHDEFYDLTVSFEEMVDQTNLLIKEMKNTLDNIAHDIKTPLARARLASEYALSNPDHEELINASEETLESLNNITVLIDSLMKISEFESKSFKLNVETFNLNKLIQEVIDLYLFVAEDKDIKIICTEEQVDLKGDRTLIKQVIANLLDNAIKYSPANTVVTIDLKKNTSHIFISVHDQGIGIDQFELNKIFERLYRSDKSRTESGFGLGLSLVKTIVEAHQGRIEVKSQLGAGTEFKVIFPV
jgi:signal transduction histidine kinase